MVKKKRRMSERSSPGGKILVAPDTRNKTKSSHHNPNGCPLVKLSAIDLIGGLHFVAGLFELRVLALPVPD